jgi:hypothetical protein
MEPLLYYTVGREPFYSEFRGRGGPNNNTGVSVVWEWPLHIAVILAVSLLNLNRLQGDRFASETAVWRLQTRNCRLDAEVVKQKAVKTSKKLSR